MTPITKPNDDDTSEVAVTSQPAHSTAEQDGMEDAIYPSKISSTAATAAAAAAARSNKGDESTVKKKDDASSSSSNSRKKLLRFASFSKKKKCKKKRRRGSKTCSLPPPPPARKVRGCRCCQAPLEGVEKRRNKVMHPPLWETDGQPGLGWWSDAEHAAEVAALQYEEKTRKTNQATKERNRESILGGAASTDKASAAQDLSPQRQYDEEEAEDAVIIYNTDDFLFGGIGEMILPRAKPITEIQDKHLAKQIASFAKARANEAAKIREMSCVTPVAAPTDSSLTKQAAMKSENIEDPTLFMGLFDYEELKLGKLLGVGGFSHVYEIVGFQLKAQEEAEGSSEATTATLSASCKATSPDRKERSSFTRRRRSCGQSAVRLSSSSIAGVSPMKPTDDTTVSSIVDQEKKPMSNYFSPQQQLAREFLAKHALRPDNDDTTERQQDDPVIVVGANALDAGAMSRRKSSIVSRSSSSFYNPAEHTREENSAYFRETRESLSTHLMENSTTFFSREFQDEIARAAHGSGKTTPRYAVKHLKPSLLQESPMPNKFAKAAMDLACEAQMMLGLSHPNIVKLRGWAAGGPGNYKEGKHTSYFLIMDRLKETLHDRIADWRIRYEEQHSWKRRLDYVLARCKAAAIQCFRFESFFCRGNTKGSSCSNSDKGSPRSHRSGSFSKSGSSKSFGCTGSSSLSSMSEENLLLVERVKVAYDLACALEYLHEKRIIYRDLKSTNVGFNIRGDVQIFDFGLARYLPISQAEIEQGIRKITENEDEKVTESQEIRHNVNATPTTSHLISDQGDTVLPGMTIDEETYHMSHVGTRRYTAPEVDCKGPYNLKADVYSFGVVLWEIMSMASAVSKGRRIHLTQDHASVRSAKSSRPRHKGPPKMMKRRLRIMVPCPCWPKPIQTLVVSMMADNPKDRPTMKYVRATLERVYVSLTTENPEDPDSQEMYLLKRQRRRSTFCLESWAQEVATSTTAMKDFLEEVDEENENDSNESKKYDVSNVVAKKESTAHQTDSKANYQTDSRVEGIVRDVVASINDVYLESPFTVEEDDSVVPT